MAEFIKVTVQDYVATVVMDRPPVNAQHTPFREEIIAAFDAFTDRDDVRVAILTGFGKMFSAGADIGHGIRWRMRRCCRGSQPPRFCIR